MPLETATFINGLDATNPAAGDSVGQADDHLRLIKATLKATFPNVTGAVTVGQADLNATQNLQAVLNGKAASVHTHAISDVTGLQAAIDTKAPASHTHTASQISDSTATGRDLLTAASITAVRTYLGVATSGAIGSSGVTMSTGRLLGRTTASTGAVEEISVGSGLTFNAGSISVTPVPTPTFQSQVFTSNGTFTVPAGIVRIKVSCVGGGAGGASGFNIDFGEGNTTGAQGNGGGAGGTAVAYLTVTPGQSIPVTVGGGSNGSPSGPAASGGTTSFGSLLSATGGSGNGATGTPSAAHQWGIAVSGATGARAGGIGAVGATVTGSSVSVGAPGVGGFGNGSPGSGGSGGAVFVEWVG
jgi:hypothetical protein